MTVRPRRWLTLALAPFVAVALFAVPASPGYAEPGGDSGGNSAGNSATADESADEGGGNPLLNDVLESSNRRYVEAKAAVARSASAQQALTADIHLAIARRDALLPEVNAIAAQQYRTGEISEAGFLLGSTGSNDFLHKAISLQEINALQDHKLHQLNATIDEINDKQARLSAEVAQQKTNLASMQKQKEAALKALALVGGTGLTHGFVVSKSPIADPAPRNAQGGFSPEGCTVDDPTTDGCITPRTYHMYKEVKKAGFNRFVGCHRNGGPFEHPKGRACDWSLQQNGFSVSHNDDMRRYGNNLMAFLVRNADRLGIYYVIWFAQIWFPATGWRAYHGVSEHKDHVHVSML